MAKAEYKPLEDHHLHGCTSKRLIKYPTLDIQAISRIYNLNMKEIHYFEDVCHKNVLQI